MYSKQTKMDLEAKIRFYDEQEKTLLDQWKNYKYRATDFAKKLDINERVLYFKIAKKYGEECRTAMKLKEEALQALQNFNQEAVK